MSTNLLSIEQAFLNDSEVRQALNLTEIRTIQRGITNAKKKKFDQTLTLSGLVVKAFEWFSSEQGKAKMQEEGLTWSNEEFFNKVFGWQKSFSYKVLKAGKLPSEVVDTFKAKCDQLEQQGEEPNRSLEGLLKFAKVVEQGNEGGQGEEGEGEEAEVETRSATIFTMSFKHPDKNISVRINEAGEVKTTNSRDEIQSAINFLIDAMNTAQ
jgi:hypothetical protein